MKARQRHLDYLKQYRRVTYINLLTSSKLNTYLADIDRQAQERFERLIEGMKQAQGILPLTVSLLFEYNDCDPCRCICKETEKGARSYQ